MLQYMLSLKTHWSDLQTLREKEIKMEEVFKMAESSQLWVIRPVKVISLNTTKSIKINQWLVIFNHWSFRKEFFRNTIVCDYGHRFHWKTWFSAILCWPKMRKCDQQPTTFYIWTTVSLVQAQTFINEKTFVSPGKFTASGLKVFSSIQQIWFKILQMFLRRFNFMMTFFGEPLEGKRW